MFECNCSLCTDQWSSQGNCAEFFSNFHSNLFYHDTNHWFQTKDHAKQMSLGTILFAMLIQKFFPFYFGSQIMAISDKLSTDMFQSNWISFTNKQKQMVSMFIECTKRNTFILVGNMLIISLQTYRSVIYSFHSYILDIIWSGCLIISFSDY